jgi:hypothetical protein
MHAVGNTGGDEHVDACAALIAFMGRGSCNKASDSGAPNPYQSDLLLLTTSRAAQFTIITRPLPRFRMGPTYRHVYFRQIISAAK